MKWKCMIVVAGTLFVVVSSSISIAVPAEPGPAADMTQLETDWLRADTQRYIPAVPAPPAPPEADAAGAVDGVKNGRWGFHTNSEDQPWWQVDLGSRTALSRITIYNRMDFGAELSAKIQVLVSDDGVTFHEVYRHNGTPFGGQPDNNPLILPLNATTARYVRLQLPGTGYFHLDEVEVSAPGCMDTIALGKPALQSSVSQWSSLHGMTPPAPTRVEYPTIPIIESGKKLAEHLREQGVTATQEKTALEQCEKEFRALAVDADDSARKRVYHTAHRIVRRLVLKNPLLDFDTILFVKGAPTRFPHMSDQYYGWWSRPGGGMYLLHDFKSNNPRLECLTGDFPEGSFMRPDLSYDGKKVLFSYARYYDHVADIPNKFDKNNVPEDAFYHVYEMNIDGTGVRQLTRGKYDDIDARYLPGGKFVFVSTRKGTAVQCGRESAMATMANTLPDSYVRCGGDNYRPVPVFTLHRMDTDGRNIIPLSAFENFEWGPSVTPDGRILFTRWDYIDRPNGDFFSLWSCNQDGRNGILEYGNFTHRPQVTMEARAIPGSPKLVFTASAHHAFTGGSLVLFDRRLGTEGDNPIERITPEVPFPETEAWAEMYYANPWPLSEQQYLVAWSDRKLPPHGRIEDIERNPGNATGIYLYDTFGNLTVVYRDPSLASSCPIPVRPRPEPLASPDIPSENDKQENAFVVQDVYQGLTGIERGTVKRLRIVGVPPKVQPFMNSPNLGVSAEDPGKFVIGTVPVEEDGSAYFYCPAGVPVFFQALDEKGLAVQTMRTLTYVWPGQTLSCVGCHESRQMTPRNGSARPLATLRHPSRIEPGPDGSWPLRFDTLVQPMLDKNCISCHALGGSDPKAAALDLTAGKGYDSLLAYGGNNLRSLAYERAKSIPGEGVACTSKLLEVLRAGEQHAKLKLDTDSITRLVVWMDVYAQRLGHFSNEQEQELIELKGKLSAILEQ